MRNKLTIVFLGLLILAAGIAVFAARAEAPEQNTAVAPSDERVESIDDGFLYASNKDLRDLLFGLDLFFKNQGLVSDRNSDIFEFPDHEKTQGDEPQNNLVACVEFIYFEQEKQKFKVTLVPPSSTCFENRTYLNKRINELHNDFRYVYYIQ